DENIARVNALTVEQVRQLYQEQVGAQAGEFVVVGDFDPAEASALVGDLLKDWKAPVLYHRIPQEAFMKVPGGRESINTPDKVDKAIAEELDRLRKDGVGATELAEAKKALLQQMKVERSTDSMLAMRLSQNLHAGRTFAYYADLEKKITDLTLEAVNSAIRN